MKSPVSSLAPDLCRHNRQQERGRQEQFGGALGLVLFVAQSISVAFYAIGFGEAVVAIAGGGPTWLPSTIAAGAVLVLFGLAWTGADAATRFQYVVMTVLVLALAAFFIGKTAEHVEHGRIFSD